MLYKFESNIIISTSRKPSQITRRFAQFIKHYFNAKYINRGKMSFRKVISLSKNEENSRLLILNETKGNPSSIDVYNTIEDDENPIANVNFTTSLPPENSKINTDSSNIIFINKNKQITELFQQFRKIETKEHIRENCIIIKESDKNLADILFIDKNGNDTKYKLFLKSYKLNGD